MIPSYFKIEILALRALLCAVGSKGLTFYYFRMVTGPENFRAGI